MIRVLAIGKAHESWVTGGIERYQKRLRPPFNLKWDLIGHSRLQGNHARLDESVRLLSRIHSDEYVILLDESGIMIGSPALSQMCERQLSHGKLTFIIGGAFGVNDELRGRANTVLSLSDLVFPHQLVRLILVEQLYRAQQILVGSGYHHE